MQEVLAERKWSIKALYRKFDIDDSESINIEEFITGLQKLFNF